MLNQESKRFFKTDKIPADKKADATTLAVRAINKEETKARNRKTEHLRQLRLEKEASEESVRAEEAALKAAKPAKTSKSASQSPARPAAKS